KDSRAHRHPVALGKQQTVELIALQDRQDPLAQRDSILLERYRFSREGVIYLINLLDPHIKSSTRRLFTDFFYYCRYIIIVNEDHAIMTMPVNMIRLSPGFPNVIDGNVCAVYGTKAPPGPNEGDFVNRKGIHSINVWCVTLCTVLPMWKPNGQDPCMTPEFLESHVCAHYLNVVIMTGSWSETGAIYNAALARTRAHIEMTFGQLKERFQCLKSLRVAPDRACNIIVACAVLHNIATITKERTPVVEIQPDDDLQPVHLDQPSGRAARDRIVAHHFS
uniref:DDE Tnp4 domain-containing protein n=1 Tax=Sinocyclocheilus rhinocerous TaxID=307959 RepID=A0A673NKF7_9TELE